MLQIKHIEKSFPGVRALSDVSIDFRPSEVHAIVGENGAGKSTLIKILTGAYQRTSGTVLARSSSSEGTSPSSTLRRTRRPRRRSGWPGGRAWESWWAS